MKNIIKLIPLLIVLITVSLLVSKIMKNSGDPSSNIFEESPMVGKKLKFDSSVGLSEKDFIGKKTVINIFASWCVACVYEHPLFMSLKGEENLQLFGVAWRDKKSDTEKWLKKHGNPYAKVFYDSLGKYGISIGLRGVPETFLVDEEGIIKSHHRGNIDEDFINRLRADNEK